MAMAAKGKNLEVIIEYLPGRRGLDCRLLTSVLRIRQHVIARQLRRQTDLSHVTPAPRLMRWSAPIQRQLLANLRPPDRPRSMSVVAYRNGHFEGWTDPGIVCGPYGRSSSATQGIRRWPANGSEPPPPPLCRRRQPIEPLRQETGGSTRMPPSFRPTTLTATPRLAW
jgi:hypothetical protein